MSGTLLAEDQPQAPPKPAAPPDKAAKEDNPVKGLMKLFLPKKPGAVQVPERMALPFFAPERRPGQQAEPESNTNALKQFAPSISLNTNEELERLLDRANQLVEAGRADLAPTLWQKVLDEASTVLVAQRDGEAKTSQHLYVRYRPFKDEAEGRIAASGSVGLKAYRLQADALAKQLLADESEDTDEKEAARERACAEVVQKYFISSLGDNAAFELACRHLEQRRFLNATALLFKLASHPDCDIPEKDIVVRQLVSLSRLGARAAAEDLFATKSSLLDPQIQTLVRQDMDRQRPVEIPTTDLADPRLLLGPKLNPALPPEPQIDAQASSLVAEWRYQPHFPLKKAVPRTNTNRGVTVAVINGRQVLMQMDDKGQLAEAKIDPATWPDLPKKELATSWTNKGWTPAGHAVHAGSKVLVKAQDRLVCCDSRTGQVAWMGRKSKFPIDSSTEQLQFFELMGWQIGSNTPIRPRGLIEAQLFGDRIAHAVVVAGELAINVEGEFDAGVGKPAPADARQDVLMNQQPGANHGARNNFLAAYDLRTGKLRWHRSTSDQPDAAAEGFLAPPIFVKNALLVPTLTGNKLEVLSLDPATGKTTWRVSLLDGASGIAEVWAPIGMSADDATLYVSTGFGAVMALNHLTGEITWATAYPRKQGQLVMTAQLMVGRQNPEAGLPASRTHPRENVAFRTGDLVVVMAADSDQLMAFDARSGAFRWESPLAPNVARPSRDVVGIRGDLVVTSGSGAVRAHSLKSGKLNWDVDIDTITGRAILTADSLFVPTADMVLKLDPQTGRNLATIVGPVNDELPLGNLSTDGKRLFVTGPGFIMSLKSQADAKPESKQVQP